MAPFKPDKRQQRLIDAATKSHREAQASGRHAPDRLVEKWSSEVGLDRMIRASERLGLYDAEFESLPPKRKTKKS